MHSSCGPGCQVAGCQVKRRVTGAQHELHSSSNASGAARCETYTCIGQRSLLLTRTGFVRRPGEDETCVPPLTASTAMQISQSNYRQCRLSSTCCVGPATQG